MVKFSSKPVIVIMGPQGSGKGTQARLLAEHLNGVTFSSGDLWRQSADPDLRERQAKGVLAKSDVIIGLVGDFMRSVPADRVIVTDGFPRLQPEAEWLLETLPSLNRELQAVIVLMVPREESVKRLLLRAKHEERTDDTPQTINQRLDIYESDTQQVIQMWRSKGLLNEVDGMGSVEEIAERIKKVVGK
jgi:adenylate kinase